MLSNNLTEEQMIDKARVYSELIYRYTREHEADEDDKFLYQLMGEYLQLKERKMTKCEVLGDNFHLEDDEMDVDFEFDNETGMVEIYVADEQRSRTMYVKREIALVLALWMKERVSR